MQNSEKAIQDIKAQTVEEAILSPSPVIGNICLVHEGAAVKTLTFLIADVLGYLNLGNTMNAAQVLQTVTLILQDPETKNLKPDDFKVCFSKAKKGDYGKSYNRIDGQIIFEWLRAYMAERLDFAENMSIREHTVKVSDKIDPSEVNPEGQKKVIEMLKSVLVESETKKLEPVKREKSPRDQFIQKCLTEFDEIVSLKPSVDEFGMQIPGRYTDMEITDTIGFDKIKKKPITKTHVRPIDVTDYLKIKVSEYDLNQKH